VINVRYYCNCLILSVRVTRTKEATRFFLPKNHFTLIKWTIRVDTKL